MKKCGQVKCFVGIANTGRSGDESPAFNLGRRSADLLPAGGKFGACGFGVYLGEVGKPGKTCRGVDYRAGVHPDIG